MRIKPRHRAECHAINSAASAGERNAARWRGDSGKRIGAQSESGKGASVRCSGV